MSAKNILAFRFSSLGDVALTVPVIWAALEQNPDVKITMVTPAFMHALFPQHLRLRFIDFDKNGAHKGVSGLWKLANSLDVSKFDAIADLHQVLRTQFLTSFAGFQGIKVAKINKNRAARRAFINGSEKSPLRHTASKYADVFRSLGLKVDLTFELNNYRQSTQTKKNAIGVAPFARHEGKKYPLRKLKEVVKVLAQKMEIHVFGSQEELAGLHDWREISNVHLCDGLRLEKELELIASLQLMISMDSANMHLASLVGVPVVSIWGVTHPDAGFLGYGQSKDWVVQDTSLSWRPTSIYGKTLGPKDNPTGMDNITPDMILNKVELVLNANYV